jgi:hypothetical protein
MEIGALTLGTGGGTSATICHLPLMSAGGAFELSFYRHFYSTSFDSERFALHQRPGDFFMSRLQDATKGGAGDVHFRRGIFLV